MRYLLGFDCGATNIEYKLTDIKGEILLHSKLDKPSNVLVNGVEAVSEHITQIVREIVNSKLNDNEQPGFAAIVVGAAGAGRKADADALQKSLSGTLSGIININQLLVFGDATIALEAAFPNKPGCILIAGTGSIIYGKDESGTIYRTGGYGRIIGDAGSGYSIGIKALRQAAKDFDGHSTSTIVKFVKEKYFITNLDELITRPYKENFDIASLAEHIISLAQSGDRISDKILNEESDELIMMIRSIMQKMNVDKIDIAFSGSLIDGDNYYSKMLKNKIGKKLKFVAVIEQKFKPVDGAIAIAKGLKGG